MSKSRSVYCQVGFRMQGISIGILVHDKNINTSSAGKKIKLTVTWTNVIKAIRRQCVKYKKIICTTQLKHKSRAIQLCRNVWSTQY